MSATQAPQTRHLAQQLAEAQATIEALLSGQIDAVIDPKSKTPVLLAKAQDALRESEERYRRIVETANEGIWTIDTHSNVTFANGRLAEILGYRREEMLGKSLFHFLPKSARARAALRIERARHGISEETEVDVVRKDGTELWALIKTSPIRDQNGKYIGILAMLTDRTSHKQAEEALRKSEEQYRQIVEATSDGILKSDDAANIVFVNQRFADMLGYEPRELIGTSAFAFMSATARGIATDAHRRRHLGVSDAIDTTFRHKNGTDISVNIVGSALLDGEGHYIGNLGLVRDVSEQKKLQAQLMVSDRMASVGTLAAGVAHEINNPLAAVIMNLDCMAGSLRRLVERDAASVTPGGKSSWFLPEITASLDDARDSARRVGIIVRDLKIFSRAPGDESRGSVDVQVTIESSLRMAWNEIRHRARLVKRYAPGLCVAGNEARLGQVFLNLIVNAAHAVEEGRAEDNEISVSTRLEGGRVVVEVSDTGVGIPPEIIHRIFDAFFTTKEVGIGTGLGLAICQRIVADMDGELTVESEVGRGTTFRVTLPIAHTQGTTPPPPMEEISAVGRRGRILVVDDEAMVLRVMERVLAGEHDTVAVVAAQEALALVLGGEKFDLILCDLMMPDMTGIELYDELSRVAPAEATKMVFLTGGAFTEKARQFLSETPREYLEKPFEPSALRALVQRHLRASGLRRAVAG
jgi:two-component system cell cycle sensor histidine kinase/response regulator CckA